ncbi:nuclease-related domain-containing protein [Neobacillus terrae]|uniref:nuclease-related domain-containing protein n=1 Tax=Neobacillus terrae TaxID=3034837 RepID=UPI00140BB539|nr:nuclease-related domain-containing protein [Neobacillus terrae]NHM33764.1 NERD domain-containing protein [Neobacillus terrae]
MIFKARTPSELLRVLKLLNMRMKLSSEDEKYYLNLEKGFEGELKFDLLTGELQNDCFILNDLLLDVNNTRFQIDTVIIFQETVYLFEVKNYEGEFRYEDGNLYTSSGKEIKNPLDQLKRTKSMFRQLLQTLGFHYNIDTYVIFIHPEFTFFQAPQGPPFILPTQLNRFMKKLNTKSSYLNSTHRKLADKLLSLHLDESLFARLPVYDYQQLKKGIFCPKCSSFSVSIDRYLITCIECGFTEIVETTVLEAAKEYKLLFPERKITTNEIYEWCGRSFHKKRISRILAKNYKIYGLGQWAFYQ